MTAYRFARQLVVVLLILGGVVALAHAANNQLGYPPGTTSITAIGYYPDQQTVQPYRGPVVAADFTALTNANLNTLTPNTGSAGNGGRILVKGRPNVPVSLRFTNAFQQAAICYAGAWVNPGAATVNNLLGISDIVTLTATQFTDEQGRFIAPTWVFDSYGASDGFVIIVTPPTTGSVYVDPGSY